MRLRDLDARLLGGYHLKDAEHEYTGYRIVDRLDDAQGVSFQCPKCAEGKERGEKNGYGFVIGAHSVICWFANPRCTPVPADAAPLPGRWYFTGTSLDDLTFTGPGAYSVQLVGGCNWHGFVEQGEANTR